MIDRQATTESELPLLGSSVRVQQSSALAGCYTGTRKHALKLAILARLVQISCLKVNDMSARQGTLGDLHGKGVSRNDERPQNRP